MGIGNLRTADAYRQGLGNGRNASGRRAKLKKFLGVSLAAAAVGVCAVGSADANTSTGQSTSASTSTSTTASEKARVDVIDIKLKNEQHAVTDLGPAGPSLGDYNSFSGRAIRDGREVGLGAGSCKTVHIEGDKATTQCVITVEIGRGSVTMQSLAPKGGSSLDMAITGGTGAYAGARGTAHYWAIGTPDECMRVRLLR
ncbi:allene oxide cyclase barrel-like domain-containing protein [Streptomyces buecherae]|uniref:allene oxide cyclase barrel-like domain-containing protein n=1 Tax=Streptomyces buecherae TaxID=2763006 RepID=UPI00364C48AA